MNILIPIVAIAAGIALVVFGGYDDSPGAQGLGLIIAIVGAWRLIRGVWFK